jgi:predicted alpha/beta superfamily hydrolase
MKRIVPCLVALVLLAGIAAAGVPIVIGETITIQSKILGEGRTILVSTPPDYDTSQGAFPVLYMTDGDAHLSHTRGTVDFLVRNALMPSMIIVGVTNTDRTRDLTPTRASITEDDGTVREFPTSGGAPRFLDFFETELFPYIESHYRTQPYRVFSGHSFGGLFALNTFFTRPEMFDAILSISPSLQWDDELPVRQARSYFVDLEKLDASLFVTMANEEEGDPRPNRLDRLEKALEKATAEGFEWQIMRMPDETHGSVVLRSQYWGLRAVFEGWQLPRDPDTGAYPDDISEIEAHFAALSKRVGYSVKPNEDLLNQVGYQILGREEFDAAIAVFKYNVKIYPGSANVYDSLGEAFETADRLEEALASYAKAVVNAEKIGDDRVGIFTANRDRAQKALESSK